MLQLKRLDYATGERNENPKIIWRIDWRSQQINGHDCAFVRQHGVIRILEVRIEERRINHIKSTDK